MTTIAAQLTRPVSSASEVKSMPLWQAILYFGLPALLFRFCLYNGIPVLKRLGLSPFEAYVVGFTVPAAILFAFAIGFYTQDGYPLTWDSFKTRFRLFPMGWKDWLWAVGALIVSFLSIGLVGFTAQLLIKTSPFFAPPAFFPPWQQPGAALDEVIFEKFIGVPLNGNWGVVILLFIMLFFNIFGEEFWWRGYILPRQEKVHGRWTWAIHGILWLLWHVTFYPWQLFALLPICLILPYAAQRLQNTWVAIVIHLQNAVILLVILAMVLN